ncbi:MAG: Bug family tripartite tricarboxylate transporter substrate binding protein [Pigmentiphaga sp.]|uniref:Bug family tripartite tricarboxylate transporter substrate binding protein n=1 Tax=Pigmentiphaga sp. TaxID=1977564 RepID=UPI0029B1A2B8|nr:Bug family tripartite tricarboxylate transporter substrate binding protein [Pigmentiphaga sp.]MDX3905525.1 Bug family tripartite tricarboxylate transporter substrate binding protein [Pigmentiphaga sp.]
MKRRFALRALSGLSAAALLATAPVHADNRPIRMLVGYPAGGSSDVIARHLAQGLQKELGRNVVVENRPGAGGQIAAQALKAARPDGTTLFMSNSHTVAMIPLTLREPGFDTAKDFVPVSLVAVNPDVFVLNTDVIGNPKAGLLEFAEWVKANPGKGNVGVPAPASAPDFAVGVIGKALGADLKSVPYRGDAPIVQDVMAGQIPAAIGSVGAMLQPAKAGRLRIVAVNGTARLPFLPDVPTYLELGIKGYEDVIFNGVFAPAGTPADLIDTYSAAIAKVVKSPEFAEKLAALNIEPVFGTASELNARLQATHEAWSVMVKNAGYQPQ